MHFFGFLFRGLGFRVIGALSRAAIGVIFHYFTGSLKGSDEGSVRALGFKGSCTRVADTLALLSGQSIHCLGAWTLRSEDTETTFAYRN